MMSILLLKIPKCPPVPSMLLFFQPNMAITFIIILCAIYHRLSEFNVIPALPP